MSEQTTPKTKTITVISVDAHRRLKVLAARKAMTMQAYLDELILGDKDYA